MQTETLAQPPQSYPGLPLVGVLPQMAKDFPGLLLDAHRRFGDIVRLPMGPNQGVLVAEPEAIRYILRDPDHCYTKSILYDRVRPLVGNGILTSEGDFWRKQRRLIQPAFHSGTVRAMLPLMASAIDATFAQWRKQADAGTELDFGEGMTHLTLDVILRTMFGALSDERRDEMVCEFTRIGDELGLRMSRAFVFEGWPTPSNLRLKRAMQAFNRIVQAEVLALMSKPAAEIEGGAHLLSLFIRERNKESGSTMTDAQLLDEVNTILAAGHDTSANTLAWTTYLLGRHPEAQNRVASEVMGADLQNPTVESLQALTYTRAVLYESMRYFPPVWAISRTATRDHAVQGRLIKKGSLVMLSQFVMGRSEKYWPEPMRFHPDRFLQPENQDRNDGVYFPFGLGPRACIGSQFAMAEMTLILSRFIREFEVVLTRAEEPGLRPLVTLKPLNGVWAKLRRRQTH